MSRPALEWHPFNASTDGAWFGLALDAELTFAESTVAGQLKCSPLSLPLNRLPLNPNVNPANAP